MRRILFLLAVLGFAFSTTTVFGDKDEEYYVSYFSPKFGQQRMIFTYTGSETVVEAVRRLNDENAATLAPGTSERLIVLRSEKAGKPVLMLEVDFNEAVAEQEKDLPLRPGDTLLMTVDFRSDDLRPDSAIDGMGFSSPEEMFALMPQPEPANAEEKIASEYRPEEKVEARTIRTFRDRRSRLVSVQYFRGRILPCTRHGRL